MESGKEQAMKTQNTLSIRLAASILPFIFVAIASISSPSGIGAWSHAAKPEGDIERKGTFNRDFDIPGNFPLAQVPSRIEHDCTYQADRPGPEPVTVTPVALRKEASMLALQSRTSEGACRSIQLGEVVINVPSVEIRPIFRLNGHPFPGAEAGVAVFSLWASRKSDLFDGQQLSLGQTDEPTETFRVIPGVYDVYYSWVSGTRIPRNALTRVLKGVVLDRNRDLTIDVPVISIAGLKLHNGAPFNYEGAAELSLRALDWPGVVPLGDAQSAEFVLSIIPGTYAFEYHWQQGANFPNNRHAQVSELHLLRNVQNLLLNVPSLAQTFEFLYNGNAFPATIFDRGNIVLRRGVREEVLVGPSDESPSTIRLIPGTYDVHWRHLAGATVPQNADGIFLHNFDASGPSPLVVDVPSIVISGNFLVNGQPTPASPFENARLGLETPDTGDHVNLGETQYGAYDARVLPGVYDIVYEHLAGGAILPWNPRATLAAGWHVESNPTRDIDIPVGTNHGSLLLNGEAFPVSEFERGDIYVVSLKGDQTPIRLGSTDQFIDFATRLLPGRYQMAYAHVAGAAIVPRNTFTTFGPTFVVRRGADSSAVFNVEAAPLTVSYRHNGVPLPEGGPENVNVLLHRNLNTMMLPNSADDFPNHFIAMEGRFDLFYHYIAGSGLPKNIFMPFACWDLVR
jgi:hypothetical protein